jgi:PIN domain nuclease of toxin-antitoxin system
MTELSTEDLFDVGAEDAPANLVEVVKGACEEAVELDHTISGYEQSLKAAKGRLHHLRSKSIPEAMSEAGIGDVFSLDSGHVITVSQFVSGTLPKDPEKRAAAIEKIDQVGGGALIKTQFALAFGKGEKEEADALVALLAKHGLYAEISEGVHPQSLQAFAREKLRNGEDMPLEELGLYAGTIAKIKAPKVSK